ncbi:MAG: hypothetical protein ACE5HX_11625 [bacterium]
MKSCFFIIIIGIAFFNIVCGKDNNNTKESTSFLNIENGHFEVDAIILTDNSSINSGTPLGSGSLSFEFTGDDSGTFSVSGSLVSQQTQNNAVGAIVVKLEENDVGTLNEGFSIVGFHPRGDGKADVFVLGTKNSVSLFPFKSGDVFGIGTFDPFNGLYLQGIKIEDWWDERTNKLEVSDKAFTLEAGIIQFTFRDSTHISGIFFGTTDTNQSGLSKRFILN